MTHARDCCQIATTTSAANTQPTSDIYNITDVCSANFTNVTSFVNGESLQARCDMETDEGGWLVILRRTPDASPRINFTRSWTEYENGFGDLNTEFWYGLRNMHCLTQRDDLELKIDVNNGGSGISWTYQQFKVARPDNNYRLTIGGGVGTGNDAMAYHNGRDFSTYDRDNDGDLGGNCATRWGGSGWWYYNSCYTSLLTRQNPHWPYPTMYTHTEMKVRPESCLE